MDDITEFRQEYSYILPELNTEEFLLMMYALSGYKESRSYGIRMKQLIEKMQSKSKQACPNSDLREGV